MRPPSMRACPSTPSSSGAPGAAGVAAGSAGAVRAGVEVLAAGGSAVDAVLACSTASAVTEPVLSSLGGGGFLLHAPVGGPVEVLDFFVAVPGLDGRGEPSRGSARSSSTSPRRVRRPAPSEQVFHGGWGTVAVPGSLAGILDAHSPLGAPAARGGPRSRGRARPRRRLALRRPAPLPHPGHRPARPHRRAAARCSPRRTGRGATPTPSTPTCSTRSAVARSAQATDPAYADAAARGVGGRRRPAHRARPRGVRAVLRRRTSAASGRRAVWTNPPPAAGGAIVLDALRPASSQPSGISAVDWAAVAAAQADAVLAHRAPGQVPTGTTHASVSTRGATSRRSPPRTARAPARSCRAGA